MPEVVAENSFVEKLFQIVAEKKVQLLMPSSHYDIFPYSKYRKELEQLGAIPVVTDLARLEICRDKLLTYQSLSRRFDLPFTSMDSYKAKFPAIAKPRFGKGSRNVIKVEDENELQFVKFKYKDMVYQEFLPGNEYTVDVLSDLSKEPVMAVPRMRLQTKAGVSTRGRVVRNTELEEKCMQIAKSMGIVGPCCVQMKETADGTPKLIEINPRMGGGTIFTTLAGANFPKMILDMVEGRQIKIPKVSEVTVVRYYEEIIVGEEKQERKRFFANRSEY
jgi:carbamoyl-phosphate synthase large subunit